MKALNEGQERVGGQIQKALKQSQLFSCSKRSSHVPIIGLVRRLHYWNEIVGAFISISQEEGAILKFELTKIGATNFLRVLVFILLSKDEGAYSHLGGHKDRCYGFLKV